MLRSISIHVFPFMKSFGRIAKMILCFFVRLQNIDFRDTTGRHVLFYLYYLPYWYCHLLYEYSLFPFLIPRSHFIMGFFCPKGCFKNPFMQVITSNLSTNVRTKRSVFAFQKPFCSTPLLSDLTNFVLVLWGLDKLREYLCQITNKCWSSDAQREYTFK